MLIARAFPVMRVYTKPRGGQRAYKGHVITLPQDVQQLADILPRCPKDLPVIIFTINGKDNSSSDFVVRHKFITHKLKWVASFQQMLTLKEKKKKSVKSFLMRHSNTTGILAMSH